MIRNHFSLNAWHPFGDSQFCVLRFLDFDWCRAEDPETTAFAVVRGWFAVTFTLLGFGFCVTYWPKGKQ